MSGLGRKSPPVAVMREGLEVALFMYGLVAAGGSTATELVIGSVLGLAAGVAVSALTYLGLVAISQRRLFAVTTGLLLPRDLRRRRCSSCSKLAF